MKRKPHNGLLLIVLLLATLCGQTPVNAEDRQTFSVGDHRAFVLQPPASARIDGPMPWVWYAPTLENRLPSRDKQRVRIHE